MELRLLIYKEALTGNSGFLAFPYEYLSSLYRNHSLAISLLATCSDIYHSATPLIYTSNVFLIVVNACIQTYKLTIFPSTLPSHVLPQIEHAFIVLDARLEAYGYFPSEISEISEENCYSNLREMTGLKSLGMTIVTKSYYTTLGTFDKKLGALIRRVIKSVPKECELHFGKTSDAEMDFVGLFTVESYYGPKGPFIEVAEDTLTSIGEEIGRL